MRWLSQVLFAWPPSDLTAHLVRPARHLPIGPLRTGPAVWDERCSNACPKIFGLLPYTRKCATAPSLLLISLLQFTNGILALKLHNHASLFSTQASVGFLFLLGFEPAPGRAS